MLIKFKVLLKKLFSIFLIFNLTFVSTAQAAGVFVDSFDISNEDTTPQSLAFNNDGTKMFVVGRAGKDINEYTLSTGFDVSTASFVDSFDVSNEETEPKGLAFNNDGTKMFVVGYTDDEVLEYNLSPGFDVSTASFVDGFSVRSEDLIPAGLAFNNDGTKMFVAGQHGDDVNEYTLSTGFDVSTASFVDSFDVSSEDTSPLDLKFNTDGTRMFVVGFAGDDINEYTLSTGFDVSTASFVDRFDVSTEESAPTGLAFNDDGTKMFVTGKTGDDVNEYTLSCAYKVTSSSTCADPSTIKEVVASIETQIEIAKRFAKKSSGAALKRLSFIRSQKKNGSLWSFIGNSQDIDVNFSNKNLNQLTNLAPELSIHPLQKILPEDWALWSEGSVSFGKISETYLSSAQNISALGISIGVDKKIDNNKISRFFNKAYGGALRLGRDEVDIGTYGSKVDMDAISLSIYGTHYSDESRFIDSVIGASYLNTDLVRKNSGDTDTNNGERKGKQIYGSMKFGREFEHNEMNVVPTGRIDISRTRLEGYTESGTEALNYDDQDIRSLMASLGVMIDRDYTLGTGMLKNKANFEYSKELASNSKANSYYVSDSSKTYTYNGDENTKDILKGSLGFDFTNQLGLTLSGELEHEKIIHRGHVNTIYFTASFLSRKETEYLFAFSGDEVVLDYKRNINGLDITVGSNYTLMSEIPDYGADIKVSRKY